MPQPQPPQPVTQPAVVLSPPNRWSGLSLNPTYRPSSLFTLGPAPLALEPPQPARPRSAPYLRAPAPTFPPKPPLTVPRFRETRAVDAQSRRQQTLPSSLQPSHCPLPQPAPDMLVVVSARAPLTGSSMRQAFDDTKHQLLLRFVSAVHAIGPASALFSEAASSAQADALIMRAASRFAPSTLNRYLNAWHAWTDFCSALDASPVCPASGVLPDWLYSQQSAQGLATGPLRALTWMSRTAGLPALLSCLESGLCRAFASASNPAEKREALPFSVSFVAWLERLVCSESSSHSEVFQVGTLLLAIWSSLRWNDALWAAPRRVVLRQADNCISGTSARTKTTRSGMPWGCSMLGLTGTATSCWGLRFWSVFRCVVSHTEASFPEMDIDYLPSVLSSASGTPCIVSPMLRPAAVPWIRRLLSRHWREHCSDPLPEAYSYVGVHSAKATVLSWARQLHLDPELRRIQGHHRGSGSDASLRLYSRDDVSPMLLLQSQVIERIRSGFRPLQSLDRGAAVPLVDFHVPLPPPASDLPAAHDPYCPELDQREETPVPDEVPEPSSPSAASSEDCSASSSQSCPDESEVEIVPLPDVAASPSTLVPVPAAALTDCPSGPLGERYLLNPRTSVLRCVAPCDDDDPRMVMVSGPSSQVYFIRPACGSSSTFLSESSFCTHAPQHATLCLRHGCAQLFPA